MKKLSPKKYALFIAIIVLGIGIDQLTKFLSVKFLAPIRSLPIIKGVIHLTYLENRGAAFGMFADSRWIFMAVSTIAIIGMTFYLFSGMCQSRLYEISISLIISGGIGNMIDRIALGYVVDMIDFRLIKFAIFNGADSLVCIGAGLIILALIDDAMNMTKDDTEEDNNAPDSN